MKTRPLDANRADRQDNNLDSTEQGVKLTATQSRVMRWMSHSWRANLQHGAAVYINGKRVCNIDTMTALERLGLVVKDSRWTWQATTAGRNWSE